jgi:D-glycerate 3-kinase
MPTLLQEAVAIAIHHHQLPDNFAFTVETWFWPLSQAIVELHRQSGRSLAIGINGSQGSGKSTLADFLTVLLKEAGLNCAILSIDDLYLTRSQRQQLATAVHPLLATRGVPGTHDVQLGIDVIKQLLSGSADTQTPLPRFNKAIDDRFPQSDWPVYHGRADIVILEGWCVGARPQTAVALHSSVNELEANEDPDGVWRQYVNTMLANEYQTLFRLLDWQIMLAAPSFDCVYAWRKEQEAKLAARIAKNGGDSSGIMNEQSLRRFIQHYERITCQLLSDMPARADWLFTLANDHHIVAAEKKSA